MSTVFNRHLQQKFLKKNNTEYCKEHCPADRRKKNYARGNASRIQQKVNNNNNIQDQNLYKVMFYENSSFILPWAR